MKRFLKNISIFLLPMAVLLTAFVVWNRRYLAAPELSNSYSLNEKLYRAPHDPLDVLAVGSSMTLCNLNSDVLVEGLGTSRFYNFGSWGFTIEDILCFTEILAERYKPSKFIIISSVVDFRPRELEYDIDEINEYLGSPFRFSSYYQHPDLKYFFEKTMDNRENQSSLTIYSSLLFDHWGGVALCKEGFQMRQHRWNHGVTFDLLSESSYTDLEKICRILNERSIKLSFVLSPLREGLVDDDYSKSIKVHAERVRGIVESAGGIFVDATRSIWEDKLFVDGTHLQAEGGRRLTKMLLQAMGEEK